MRARRASVATGRNVALKAARETVHDLDDLMGVFADLVSRHGVADVGFFAGHKVTLGACGGDRDVAPGTDRGVGSVPVDPVVKVDAVVEWH
jgi:hypothetical protein